MCNMVAIFTHPTQQVVLGTEKYSNDTKKTLNKSE